MGFKHTARCLAAALAACLALAVAAPAVARAESLERSGGQVTFTSGRTLESSLSSDEFSDIQPGDEMTLTVTLSNQYAGDTDWYVSNEVVRAFEDSGAAGGAYAYRLTYNAPDGSQTVVYDSSTVGGDDSDGLHGVSGLEDFVYLGALAEGQRGTVTLYVALDGETQGNAYMEALANLKLNFAVEVPEAGVREVTQTVTQTVTENAPADASAGAGQAGTTTAPVKTGDDTQFLPAFVAMAVSGAVLMVLAVLRLRRGHEGGEQR